VAKHYKYNAPYIRNRIIKNQTITLRDYTCSCLLRFSSSTWKDFNKYIQDHLENKRFILPIWEKLFQKWFDHIGWETRK